MSKVKHCYYCERPLQLPFEYVSHGQRATRDHIIPLSKGGVGAAINLVDCCHNCNGKKSNHLPNEVLLILEKHITNGTKWGRDSGERLLLIYKNFQKVISERVNIHGNGLYKKDIKFPTIAKINKTVKTRVGPPSKKLLRLAADVQLSVNSNLSKRGDEIIYLSYQTPEQLELAKKHGWILAKMLTEPEPNFHE